MLTLGVAASAADKTFTGTSGYKLSFTMQANVYTVAGAMYKLDVHVEEVGSNPYYYPSIYVKGVLYGNGTTNSVNDKTFTNTYYGDVSVSRGTGDCSGIGYGNFRASGNSAYGDVYGTLPINN